MLRKPEVELEVVLPTPEQPTNISLEDLLKLNRFFMSHQLALKNAEIAGLRYQDRMDELNKQIEDLKKQLEEINSKVNTTLTEQNTFMVELSSKYNFEDGREINLVTGEILNVKSE